MVYGFNLYNNSEDTRFFHGFTGTIMIDQSERVHPFGHYINMYMMIDVPNAAIYTTEKRDLKNFQALNGIRTRNLCDTGAMFSQLSYLKATGERSCAGWPFTCMFSGCNTWVNYYKVQSKLMSNSVFFH